MKKDFCTGCFDVQQPKCIINQIISNSFLEDIIEELDNCKVEETFICPVYSQTFKDGMLLIQNNCINCTLCYLTCINIKANDVIDLESDELEQTVFNNINRMAILFQELFQTYKVYPEVQVSGNFRNKRIDLILKRKNKVICIKVLKNINKYKYYFRSYSNVKEYIDNKYTNIDFSIIFIVKNDNNIDSLIDRTVKFVRLKDIFSYI